MAQIEKETYPQYLGKVLKATGVLILLSIALPSANHLGTGEWNLLWFIGIFWGGTVYGDQFIGYINDASYIPTGVISTVLLIVALILIAISATNVKKERKGKLAVGIRLVGGILAIISPIIYYFYLNAELPLFWDQYFPSIGVYLSIIGGILGIISAILVVFTTKKKSPSDEMYNNK